MKVELLTCHMSPQCVSTKMFLELNNVEYVEKTITHEEVLEMGFGVDEMPILFIDGDLAMSGFNATTLQELFNNK